MEIMCNLQHLQWSHATRSSQCITKFNTFVFALQYLNMNSSKVMITVKVTSPNSRNEKSMAEEIF